MSRITYLTAIDFGPGELKALATAPTELGVTRPLVVADKGGYRLTSNALGADGKPKFIASDIVFTQK